MRQGAFGFLIFILCGWAGPALAVPTFQLNGSGQVETAFNIEVNGGLYDVNFKDGTCAALFSGCDEPSDFVFSNQTEAKAASWAIVDQVLSVFTWNVAGCQETICYAFTPYTAYSPYVDDPTHLIVFSMAAVQFDVLAEFVTGGPLMELTLDLTPDTAYTWAVFRPAQVPEPGTILVFGLVLGGLVTLRLARKA